MGLPPYQWSASGLPTGLSIGAMTGIISGTPTGITSTQTFNPNFTVKDKNNQTGSRQLPLNIQVIRR